MKRRPMSKGGSKKVFRKSAGAHPMNHVNPRRVRGGIRL